MRAIVPGLETFKFTKSVMGWRAKGILKKMNKPIVFIGPSLAIEKARKIFNADYRPPAKKGDFLRLLVA